MPERAEENPLAEIERIRRTIVLYAHLLDDARYDDWAQLFTEDAEFWSIPGHHLPGGQEVFRIQGRAAIVESVRSVNEKMGADGGVIHFGGAPIVALDGDRARAWWDFIVVHAKPASNEVSFAGRYHADFVLSGGVWRFRRRISVRPGYPLPEGLDLPPATADPF